MLGYAVDLESGTIYLSKQGLAGVGLHHGKRSDIYCQDSPELHILSVVSGKVRSNVCERRFPATFPMPRARLQRPNVTLDSK